MKDGTVESKVIDCLLLLRGIAQQPEEFMDMVGIRDFDEGFVKMYFEQIASIMGTDIEGTK